MTIAFSDIENSTDHLVALGDQVWMQTLEAHEELIRTAVRAQRGRVVKNVGDGFMMSFASARGAVDAMCVVQRQLDSTTEAALANIRVRVGMHTGEVVTDDGGDLFGPDINVAARVGCKANGGEILVSSLTRAILETSNDLLFGDTRETEFRGIPGTHRVHPVLWHARGHAPRTSGRTRLAERHTFNSQARWPPTGPKPQAFGRGSLGSPRIRSPMMLR
jgi:adenylate cyclase